MKVLVRILRVRSTAACSSKVSWAFSIRLITSPMPSILDAMRSGWKGSMSVSFSPTPENFIGLPVTARTEMAAPPRVSPSSFVRITPSTPRLELKVSATVTAS